MNRLGEDWVRPHDLDLLTEPNGSTSEAMVERIVHLGFEVRVELVLHDGVHVSAQVTRDEAEQLELHDGQIVFVRPEPDDGVRRGERGGVTGSGRQQASSAI